MSHITFGFESQYLTGYTTVSILLPDKPREMDAKEYYESGKKYKVLWLLHGTFGDHTDWIRRSMIENTARKRDLIVVCPTGINTNYANWPTFGTGYAMFDYLFEELMPLVYNWFPASSRREDNFISGLSMGGMGTCLYAFSHPEKFGGMACLSGYATDLEKMRNRQTGSWTGRWVKSAANYASEDEYVYGYENAMQTLRNCVKNHVELPKMMFACGEDDFLYKDFMEFKKEAVEDLKIDAKWFTLPGYKHEWPFWDIAITEALEYFDIKERPKSGNPF